MLKFLSSRSVKTAGRLESSGTIGPRRCPIVMMRATPPATPLAYNAAMRLSRGSLIPAVVVALGWLCLVAPGCTRTREVEKDLKLTDVSTGWYDVGVVNGQNKIVPSITLQLENISKEDISRVQINAIFRRVGEEQAWGEHFVRAIGADGLAPGKTGPKLVFRSTLGYTGSQSRQQMLANREFVDAKVDVFGKHGSRTWVKLGEFQVDRQLVTP